MNTSTVGRFGLCIVIFSAAYFVNTNSDLIASVSLVCMIVGGSLFIGFGGEK